MDDQIRAIEEYVYGKYIEPGDHGTLDEESAVRVLDEFYSGPDADAAESYFPGVLWFELGFEQEDDESKQSCFLRAYHWLRRYRELSGEEWDPVDDRILDIEDWAEMVDVNLADHANPAVPPLPDTASSEEIVTVTAPAPAAPQAPQLAELVEEETDDHGPMMRIPAGGFLFGMDRKTVSIPGFLIDKYPVTNRQYEQFCRATGYRWPKYRTDERLNGPHAPVVGISVQDAEKYARWVGKQLPTEEQWEKACRGIDGRLYPWGETDPVNGQAAYGKDPMEGGTDPVTAHPETKSPYGVLELAGNVWEWTSSTAVDGGETVNLIKGGCYNDPPTLLRADIHMGQIPKDKYETIGFRCVKLLK